MSVQTLLLDFSVDPARLGDECGQKTIFGQLETVLKDYVPNLILAADIKVDGGSLKILTGKNGTTVSVRLFDRGLVTVNIEYYKEDNEEPLISFKSAKVMESQLKKFITFLKSQAYAPIKRCLFSRYYPTSDERLLEYDIDGVLFDEQSPFQRVQIVHSKSLGNMLVLDDLQNISEADLIYTETLMQRGKESYEGKEIVILELSLCRSWVEQAREANLYLRHEVLAPPFDVHSRDREDHTESGCSVSDLCGGDGALLYELLKEKPKFVWMLEIDEMVMDACNKHLRPICGEVLERRKGANYEIIVEDCMLTVNKFISEGKKVDYIFGDLTDIPISESACGELWEFMITILQAAFKILKTTGKFMTHGNGATSPESLELYEQELMKLKPAVTYTKSKAFVPSFLEDWIFYQISFKDNDNGDA